MYGESQDAQTNLYRMFVYTIVENLGLCVELKDDLKTFLHVLFWLQIALCTAGMAGSVVAVLVCLSRRLRSSCSVQLACLALYDAFFLLASLALSALALADLWHCAVTKVFLAVRTLALWGASYTTLDICGERCLSVACPFLAHRRFTAGLALKRSGVILALGVLFTLPFVLDLICGYSVGDECVEDRQLTPFGLVYTLYVSLILLYLLPYAAIIIINIVFAVLLCRLRRRAVRPKGENSSAEQQLSALVLGLSGWYAASMLVPSLLFLVRLTRIELFEPGTDIRVAAAADTVVVVSACSNFLFYFLLWRPCRQVLCGWLRDRTGSYRTGRTPSPTHTGSDHQHVVVSHHTDESGLQESSH